MLVESHLILKELILPPSGEWVPVGRCWSAVRVADGLGYCLHAGPTHELKTGDVVISGPNAGVTFRASLLGELRLEIFHVIPQRLNGLITVVEWRQLEQVSTKSAPRIFHYAANEVLAQRFARLAALPHQGNIAVRSALLQLWASCVSTVLPGFGEQPVGREKNLRDAFREFISKISEKELGTSTLAELAAQLNCSERHFSRLFCLEFGRSLQACQTEWCLQRAQQLLLDSNAKISSVAYDSGYRHIGYFNTMFKKRFGYTPKEWRQQNLWAQSNNGTKRPEPFSGPAMANGNVTGNNVKGKPGRRATEEVDSI